MRETKKVKRARFVVFGLVVAMLATVGLALFGTPATATAANPTTVSFQGKVVNSNGTNVADGTYSFLFKLYSASSGGSAIWTETQSTVTVVGGTFQVNLGSSCSFFTAATCNNNTPINFAASSGLYLGITFNGDTAGEMTPRVQLQSVPFAFNADRVGGLTVNQLVQLSPGAAQAGFINVDGAGTFGGALKVTSGGADIAGGLTVAGTTKFSNLNAVGVLHTSAAGGVSTSAVILGTDTSGSYLGSLGALTGLSTTGNTGTGTLTPTLSVNYGSAANTSVQGNVTLICPSGSGNLSGTGNTITLGTGGTCNPLDTKAAVAFGTSVTTPIITSTAGLAISSTGANAVTLDTGGAAGITIAGANANNVTIGNTTSNPTISFAGSGTFGTTTGQNNLNGNTVIASGKTFQVVSGLATFGGGLSVSNGINNNNGGITATGAIAGATSIGLNGAISGGTTYSGSGDITTSAGNIVATAGSIKTGTTDRITNAGNLVNIGTITAGNGDFNVNADGDVTAVFGLLNGSSTTTNVSGNFGAAGTSMNLNSAANFDVGNYVFVNNTYAKITAKATNTLTITPALVWTTGAAVTEYHVPEIGGTNLTSTLANRYGRGYFIAGVATGNGTTFYNEDSIASTLTTFNFLPANTTTLNIGGAALTELNLGSSSTAVKIAGGLQSLGALTGLGVNAGLGSIQGLGGMSITGNAAFNTSITNSGTYNSNVFTSSNLTFGGLSDATVSSALAQNLTVQSLTLGKLSLVSGSGTIGLGATTLQRSGAGGLTIDLADSTNTTLTVMNSGSGVANLNIFAGSLQTGSLAVTRLDNAGNLLNIGTISASGLLSGSGGATISGGAINLNAGTLLSTVNIATGVSTSSVNIGGGLGAFSLNSTGLDVSTAGAVSGATTITASGIVQGSGFRSGSSTGVSVTCTGNNYLPNMVVVGGIITGNAACAGIGLSDQRVKKDVVMLDSSVLDAIKNVSTYSFNFDCTSDYFATSNTYCDPTHQTGVIAQQLAQVFPDLVTQDDYGYNHVDYQGLSIYNLKAVSEIAQHIDSVGNATFNNLTVNGALTYASLNTPTGNFSASVISPLLTSNGALQINSGSIGDVVIDTGSNGAAINIGNTNALAVNISAAGKKTAIKGDLAIDGATTAKNLAVDFSTGEAGVDITASSAVGAALRIDNADATNVVDAAIKITNTGGAGYTNIINTPNFTVSGAGDLAARNVTARGGTLQLLDANGASVVSFDAAGNGSLSGNLNLASAALSGGLTVAGNVTVAGLSTFEKLATFIGKSVFRQDVEFQSHITVAKDSAGYATLRPTETVVHVKFDKEYATAPVVSATITNGKFGSYTVDKVDTKGFDVIMAAPAAEEYSFSWTAVGVKDPQTASNPVSVTP